MDKIFNKTLKMSFFGHFLDFLSPPNPSDFFSKSGIYYFSYLIVSNFIERSQKETNDLEILNCRWIEKQAKPNL